jgi:DNA polymerase III delta subunit
MQPLRPYNWYTIWAMIIILVGTNDYMRRLEVKKLIDNFVAEHGDLALEKLDGEVVDFARVNESLLSPPFLASKKMVVLRDASLNKSLAEHIDDILSADDDNLELLITEAKIDKRGIFYKTLKKQKGFREFNDLDENSLAKWLAELAKERDAKLAANLISWCFTAKKLQKVT